MLIDDGADVRTVGIHQRDQVADQRRFGEVLKLVRRVAAGVAAQPALAVVRLIPLLHHDQQVGFAQDPRAVAPTGRQLQQPQNPPRVRAARRR